MRGIRAGFKLYINSVPLHIYISMLLLLLLLLLPYRSTGSQETLALYLDTIALPMVAFFLSIYMLRDVQVTIFEANLVKSFTALYISRVLIYLLFLSISVIPVSIIIKSQGIRYLSILLCHALSYTTIFAIGLLLDNYRASMLYLAVFIFILPYASLALLNRASMMGTRLNEPLSMISFFLAPLVSYVNKNLLSANILFLVISNIAASIIMITLGCFIFSHKEFQV